MHKPLTQIIIMGVLMGAVSLVTAGEANSASSQARPAGSLFSVDGGRVTVNPQANADRNAYFGDLHVHTTYSFDAFAFGTLATPYDAYRFARGAAIKHPAGFDVQLREPLDFYAVTDHAMFLGGVA